MKKCIVLAAFLMAVTGVWAQDMKVQSAYSDMKNDRLVYAKKNIEEACLHEKTKDEVKTWAYAGLIYAKIVQEQHNEDASKAIKKQLKQIEESKEELCLRGIDCLKKALELEQKSGTHDYTQEIMEALKNLCGFEAGDVSKFYNEGKDYGKAATMWAKLVEDAELVKNKKLVDDAMYYQADSYRMLNQKDKELSLYREMIKKNTERADVYLKVYLANRQNGDTTKAINTLERGVRATAKNTDNNVLLKSTLASAYLWAKQNEKADKIVNELVANANDNPIALNSVAGIYAEQGDVEKAKEFYNKSLNIKDGQIDAYRGLGTVYFNKALAELKVANDIPVEQVEQYNNKMKEVYSEFEQAIPHFEKALTVNAKDFQSLKALSNIYSIFGGRQDVDAQTKTSFREKYQDYSTRMKELTR